MRGIKKDELEKYLKTDRGFVDAFEIRKIRLEEVAFNSGALVDINLPQVPPRAINETDTTTSSGGWAHELFVRRLGGWMGEPREQHGRIVVNTRERGGLLGRLATVG